MSAFSLNATYSESYRYQMMRGLSDPSSRKEHVNHFDGDEAGAPEEVTDLLDLGSHKGPVSAETITAILEKEVNARVEFSMEEGHSCNCEEGAAVEETEAKDDYWSPENTAARIVGFATKFYEAFAEQNGGAGEASLDRFLGIIKGAIDEGIGQAEGIIGQFNGGEVPEKNKSVIGMTREHIDRLLEEFREKILGGLLEPAAEVGAEEEAPASESL